MSNIASFAGRKIRTAWDEARETWYFAIVDVVAALTDSPNPTDYLKKMRKRDVLLGSYIETNCPQVAIPPPAGKCGKRSRPVLTPKNALDFTKVLGAIIESGDKDRE